jgi:formylglycine-generating enzyme required for sulfatase activity
VACTVNDACSGGDCMAGVPDNAFCDDENGCTEDSCDPLSGCLSTPNDSLCDDGNGCTEDSCDPLSGCLSTPNDSLCDDGNECTDDNCLPGDKGCVQTPVPDLTPCGGNDVCVSGQCVCIPKTCKDFGPLCGQMADGCGGLTPDCFPCAPGSQCSKGLCLCPDGSSPCGGLCCPALAGYDVTCNAQSHCEYANEDNAGWKKWDVWIWIPPGSFQMGSSGEGGGAGETPVHQVTFAKGYFIGKYEIVVEQYEACKAANPGMCTPADTTDWNGNGWGTNTSANNRSEHPQNGLTWQQAKDFCAWSAPSGRLPSEAEWEYAASGPVHRKYPWGDSPEPTCSNNTAVFNEAGGTGGYGCSQGGTWKVGSKSAGAAWSGALDMSGNLWEWTEDWDHGTYTGAPADGSAWVVPTGSDRVIRNGSFYSGASLMRSAGRTAGAPDIRRASHGGRCVRPL